MKVIRLIVLVATAALTCAPAQAIVFNDFVTQGDLSTLLSNSSTIGFAYAGDKFVGSVYFGSNNNQLYLSDLTGGSLALFGAPIPSFSGEIYVTSSLGIGGYGPRDVFAGSEASNTVYRIANNGASQGPFVTSGIVGGVRSIAFDPYGLYGQQMVVATNAGNVYTVDNTGVATLLTNVGEDAEGLGFAPQTFGPYAAGTLFVASEGSGSIRAVSPAGATSVVTAISGAEMLSFVPLNLGASGNPVEGFYAAAYPIKVVKADASEFLSYLGDMIVTDENGHGVYNVHWDGSNFINTYLDTFPAQPEDGIFVTSDILVPEPSMLVLLAIGVGFVLARSCILPRRVAK